MHRSIEWYNELSGAIWMCCLEVHRELGPGLLESVYEACILKELRSMGLRAENQVSIPIFYKGHELNKRFKIDILVEDEIILELKCVDRILGVHKAQLLTYLKLANKRLGFVANYNSELLKDGWNRVVNGL